MIQANFKLVEIGQMVSNGYRSDKMFTKIKFSMLIPQ